MAFWCCCGTSPGAYFSGGLTGTVQTLTDKLVFATQTTAAKTTANLGTGRNHAFSVGDANNHGYVAGGDTTTGASMTPTTSSEKLNFSTDTDAALTSVLSVRRSYGASVSERSTKGYFCGGETNVVASAFSVVTTADQVTFATDAIAAQTSANLTTATFKNAGLTNGSTKGYIAGGATDSAGTVAVATAYGITFSSDTTAGITGANLSQARYDLCATSNGSTAGYFLGGATFGPPETRLKTADKLTFASETTAAKTSANLPTATKLESTAGDGTTNSYITGGFTAAIVNTAYALSYSSETTSAVTTANLTTARDGTAATSTTGYG